MGGWVEEGGVVGGWGGVEGHAQGATAWRVAALLAVTPG